MADREAPLFHVEIIGNDVFLARRFVLRNDDGRDGMGQRVGQIARATLAVLPAEHAIHEIHVGKQVRHRAQVRITGDVVKQDRQAAVQTLLNPRDFDIGTDGDIGLDQLSFSSEAVYRGAQTADIVL